MKKINLLKSVLIPSLSLVTFSTIAIASTSCGKNASDEPDSPYVVIRAITPSIIGLDRHAPGEEGKVTPNLVYSLDEGKSWTEYKEPFAVSANHKAYLRGNNINGWSRSALVYENFTLSGNVSISGNVMGLLDNGTKTMKTIPCNSCFFDLFRNCSAIKNVDKDFLKQAENLTPWCFNGMFYECVELLNAPDLPVEDLAKNCYGWMFRGCVSLQKAPDLPAKTLSSQGQDCDGCYNGMFENCSKLNSVKISYTGEYSDEYFESWVKGVASAGTFYYNGNSSHTDFYFPNAWQTLPFKS